MIKDYRKKRVIIESPFAGAIFLNKLYLSLCIRDSLLRGEAPFASHGLYANPGALRDEVPEERRMGMQAGFEWGMQADLCAVYTDRGISPGMQEGIERAAELGIPIEKRSLPSDVFESLGSIAPSHRTRIFQTISELPRDHRIYCFVVDPHGNVSHHMDGLASWELLGILETMLVQVRQTIQAENIIFIQAEAKREANIDSETEEPEPPVPTKLN